MTMEYFSGIKTAPLSYKTQGLEDWFMFPLEVLANERPDWHSWAKTSVSQLVDYTPNLTRKHGSEVNCQTKNLYRIQTDSVKYIYHTLLISVTL